MEVSSGDADRERTAARIVRHRSSRNSESGGVNLEGGGETLGGGGEALGGGVETLGRRGETLDGWSLLTWVE